MTQTVVVNKVDVVPAGKTRRIVVSYTGETTKGETWTVGTLVTKLDPVSLGYAKELKARLDAGQGQEAADIVIVKENGYRTLTYVGKSTNQKTAPASGGTYTGQSKTYSTEGRLSDVQKGEGQQRGNVLTNATNIVVAAGKVDIKTAPAIIEQVAKELLAVSKRLETYEPVNEIELANNELELQNAATAFNDDLGF